MKQKVAIIGGGIAGLTFSLSLNRKKFDCTIFEIKPQISEIGAALSVFPNALRVIQKLGFLDEILKNSGEIKNVFLKIDSGKILTKTKTNYDLPTICMHRADLQKVLVNQNQNPILLNQHLEKIERLENGKHRLYFKDGFSDDFDVVIGADGLHSKVREFVHQNNELPRYSGYNVWRGVVKSDFAENYASETYGKGKRAGIVPIKDGYYGWWLTANEELFNSDEEGTKTKLKRLFKNWHHPIPEFIEKTENILKNSISDRKPLKNYYRENAVLIGDAAHPTTPNLGQGGCIAIEGAYILAKCIERYGVGETAFKKYENIQFPRAKKVNDISYNLGKIGQLENSFAIWLRNQSFAITPSKLNVKILDQFFSYDATKVEI